MTKTVSRQPMLALVASLVMPGLGQLYNGEPTRGLVVFLSLAAVTPVSAWLALVGPVRLMWVVMVAFALIVVGIYVYAAVQAFRSARRIGETYMVRPFNHAAVYIIVFLLGYFYVFGGLIDYTRQHLVESFYIPSNSMLPSVLKGDYLFADKRVNCIGCKTRLGRGDIAILVNPNNRTLLYLKRIIGMPGDRVEITGTDVKVNGASIRGERVTALGSSELNRLLDEHIAYRERLGGGSYNVLWRSGAERARRSFTVPNGRVFVLGDNRDAAHDSRRFGTVPLVDIVGKAKQVWFSASSASGVRWTRLGTLLEPELRSTK